MSTEQTFKRITTKALGLLKKKGIKITALTAYDFITAKLLDQAGIDLILVGDSLGMVFQGNETTLPVTMDEMIYHTKAVTKAVNRSMVVVDMPFMSYQLIADEGFRNAGRIMKETNASAVKLEGGERVADTIKKISDAGIPVMGHKIPAALAKQVTESLTIPTIGIGAGMHCDGQILVTPDMLGLNVDFHPRFVRTYANLADECTKAFTNYINDIRKLKFPSEDESY